MDMTSGAKYAVTFLFLFALLLAAANLLWTAHEVAANQAAQRRAGQQVERALCQTLDRLAALKPPPGNPVQNPARGYDQQLHATLSQLAPDLGCK